MRRHSVCIHNPPCCYITDAGTDSSLTECCFPQCKNHPKKKKPHISPSNLRYNKRRDSTQLLPKHCYGPHFSSLKCNKTKTQLLNYENKVLRHDLNRSKHKSLRKHDEASSFDMGSISSHCTSVSVDVTYEMDAVNRDIETILARYEKTFDEKPIDDIGPRLRTVDRVRHYKPKKEMLTPEQLKLLSMEKPPLDKLKELPIEYVEHLKPRPPPSHFQKEKVLTGHKGVKKDLKQSFEAFIQKEQRTGENQKSEMLESMWKNVVERGLAKEELSKNIKPIYTSMTLDENASININFGKPNPHQEAQQKRGTSVGTVTSPRMKTNPSVSTQTAVDYDTVLNRIKGTSSVITGSNKKIEESQKKNNPDYSPDLKNWKESFDDHDAGDNEKKNVNKSVSPPPQNILSSGDGSSANDPRLILNQLLANKIESRIKPKSSVATVYNPLQQKELNVYNVYTPEPINIFKQADWFKSSADQFLNSNSLQSKKPNELVEDEKLIKTMNNRTSAEVSSKAKENGPPTIEESLIETLDKNSSQMDKMMSDDKLKDSSENANAPSKLIDNVAGQDDKITYSFFQTISPDLKYLKENYDGMDTPLCVDIIKRLTDAMMKYEPGKISDELTKRNCHICLEEVRKIRAQHLKHIQIEVKHIEELDNSYCYLKDGVNNRRYKPERCW
ncbi:uncharacterized protein [Halyomorpha halys]|uniref:uncharacterized protein isoform X2 n=1 Tax=Halyomorpha halys TaxID=286706 RepID=UPI0006D51240|nr:uncharacterized protein LOC106679581 isoform X3 [Halyomorpha halys]